LCAHFLKIDLINSLIYSKKFAELGNGFFILGLSQEAHPHFPGWRFNSLIYQDILFCINGCWLNKINGFSAILIMTLDGFPNCKFTVSLNVNSGSYAPLVPFGNP